MLPVFGCDMLHGLNWTHWLIIFVEEFFAVTIACSKEVFFNDNAPKLACRHSPRSFIATRSDNKSAIKRGRSLGATL